MDIKVTSIKPTPGALQDAVGLVFSALSRSPLRGVFPTIISGPSESASAPRTFVNVTVVIVNDSNFGEVTNTADLEDPASIKQPVRPAAAKKTTAKKAVTAPATTAPAKRPAAKTAAKKTTANKTTTAKKTPAKRAVIRTTKSTS